MRSPSRKNSPAKSRGGKYSKLAEEETMTANLDLGNDMQFEEAQAWSSSSAARGADDKSIRDHEIY